jgi:uncharacterized protein YkwD
MLRLSPGLMALVLCVQLAASCGGGGGGPLPANLSPVAAITADVATGAAPLAVNFSAAASTDPDGIVSSFAWDLDGNGTFETNTGLASAAARTYTAAGTVVVRVRVADNGGATSQASVTITVTGGGGGGGFDGTFDIPPAEAFIDNSDPGDSVGLAWRKNCYHVLPASFDADRVFQNLSLSTWADEVLRLTNIERANNGGLVPLTRDNHLEMVIQAHCRDLALRDYFEHETPEGLDPFQRLDTIDPAFYNLAGENIAAGQQSPQEVVDGWMNSPGHRANILKPEYRKIGIGVYYDAAGGPFDFYYGQLFATFTGDPDAHDWIEITEAP